MPPITRRTMLLNSAAASLALAGCKHMPSGASRGPNATFRVGLVYFAPEEGAENCQKGIFDGFKEAGLERGRNLDLMMSHANAEISGIPMLIQNYMSQNVDLIMTMTT